MRPRTVTDFGNLFPDTSGVWPPPENECLVFWGIPHIQQETPLWQDPQAGSEAVREFLRRELEELPAVQNTTWPAKPSNSVRQKRMWETADGWWNGRLTTADVQKAIETGLVDDIIAQEKANKMRMADNANQQDNSQDEL